MFEALLTGGPFMMVLFIWLAGIVFISIKKHKSTLQHQWYCVAGNSVPWWVFATYMGVNAAFSAFLT